MAAVEEEEESGEAAADGEGDGEALRAMEEMVAELYRFRDAVLHGNGGGHDGRGGGRGGGHDGGGGYDGGGHDGGGGGHDGGGDHDGVGGHDGGHDGGGHDGGGGGHDGGGDHDRSGHDGGGSHDRSGHDRSGHDRSGHDRGGHDGGGGGHDGGGDHDRSGHDRSGHVGGGDHDRSGHDRSGHDGGGDHDRSGHDRSGHVGGGSHDRSGHDGGSHDRSGHEGGGSHDRSGHDRSGHDRSSHDGGGSHDRSGHDRSGHNRGGHDGGGGGHDGGGSHDGGGHDRSGHDDGGSHDRSGHDRSGHDGGGGHDGGHDDDDGGEVKGGDGTKTMAALEEEMERVVQRMESMRVSPQAVPRALYLRGRALLAAPLGSVRAEALLGRALKLEPGLSAAWTLLGETLWGRGDLDGARACFRGALQHGEDAEARRLLSMALRQSDGAAALRESLRHAEAAVRCQPCDGRNWYVLGNAYVSLFFAGGQRPEVARRALGAYGQAEKVDPTAASNPDLHLNRATLLQFEENYGAALDGYARAAALAPDWPEPRMRRARLLDYLGRICAALGAAGKARGRRRRALSPSLLGSLGEAVTPMAALGDGDNVGRALLGRVLGCVLPDERVPIAVGLSDGTGSVVLSVYNAAPGWGLAVGDAVAVGQPHVRRHHIQHQGKTFSFVGVRIPSPLALMVNGRRPPGSAVAAPRLSCSCAPDSPSLER